MSAVYDVAVVGLGAVGASVLYQLARRGVRAVGIDRFTPPHDRGSSHGESRITRQAIGEGEAYVPLVLRSHQIWEELEAATGERLLVRCGFMFLARDDAGTSHHGKSGFLARTEAAAQRFGIDHEILDARAVSERFPQFEGLVGDETAYYEPGGGYLRPEACIAAALAHARASGADVLTDRPVDRIVQGKGEARLSSGADTLVAKQVVLAAGSWIPVLSHPHLGRHIEVHRQVLHWFDVETPERYRPDASPTFIWTHGLNSRDQFYGFPPIDGCVKVAREDYRGRFDPEAGVREVDVREGEEMALLHVRGRLAGLGPAPRRSQVCHYAVTPDSDFLIDRDGLVQTVSACSGHGFKHAAAVGEAVAQAAVGETPALDLSPFAAGRLVA
jgi:sarcosine oxidase